VPLLLRYKCILVGSKAECSGKELFFGLCCVGPSLKLFQEDGVVVLVLS
jgi:hypothetical protein